jgi:uncharacterized protein YjbJ (UPF0337 family)
MDPDRIKGATTDVTGEVENTVGSITGDAKTQAAGTARKAAGKAQNLYGQAKDVACDATGAAVDYAKGPGADALANAVRENPGGSLLIAALTGFALALLLRPSPRPYRRYRYY